eukprot:4780627-Alexandrium_andersonii.AAC.1
MERMPMRPLSALMHWFNVDPLWGGRVRKKCLSYGIRVPAVPLEFPPEWSCDGGFVLGRRLGRGLAGKWVGRKRAARG